MNDQYDVVVLGTGLTECIISGLMSVSGKKVLHLDRNPYYGGESASLNLEQMYQKFKGNDAKIPENLGRSRDYNIDLIPKFIMAGGLLVKILRLTGVTRYNMDFLLVDGSYVVIKKKIHKVPVTAQEIAGSPLLGLLEKAKCKTLVTYVYQYNQEDPKTHKGWDCSVKTMRDVYKYYGVSSDTQDFLGHAAALYTSDEYLDKPAIECFDALKLYADSLAMYGKSPYIYPMYGLGELPQVFARLCAVHGGTYMLNKPVDKIHYDDNGRFVGVESEGEVAKAKVVIGDPSYFPEKVVKTGRVVRVICILDHPINGTNNAASSQIIIPQKQLNRKNDVYICVTSNNHRTAPQGKYIAIVSTTVETDNPLEEIKPAMEVVGSTLEQFVYVLDTYSPKEKGDKDGVFISKSYDATSHFESCCQDVIDLYERVTGTKFDWNMKTTQPQE